MSGLNIGEHHVTSKRSAVKERKKLGRYAAAEKAWYEDFLARHDNEPSPDFLVDEAASDDCPLHHRFEWNNKVAGHLHRLGIARHIITTIKLVVVHHGSVSRKVPEYVHNPELGKREMGYVSVKDLRQRPEAALVTFRAELQRAYSALNRALGLGYALNVQGELQDIRDRLQGLLDTITGE